MSYLHTHIPSVNVRRIEVKHIKSHLSTRDTFFELFIPNRYFVMFQVIVFHMNDQDNLSFEKW